MKIVLNNKGMAELRNSPGVISDLERRANHIAAAAGAGMETRPAEKGRQRARVAVVTATAEAARREATGRALTRAIDAGR